MFLLKSRLCMVLVPLLCVPIVLMGWRCVISLCMPKQRTHVVFRSESIESLTFTWDQKKMRKTLRSSHSSKNESSFTQLKWSPSLSVLRRVESYWSMTCLSESILLLLMWLTTRMEVMMLRWTRHLQTSLQEMYVLVWLLWPLWERFTASKM